MTDTPLQWQNRVVAYKRMRIGDLEVNPQNWRAHPNAQQAAMGGVGPFWAECAG